MNHVYSMLDLFSGLGGASEAMLNYGWEVRRYDNNPLLQHVPNTIIHDVTKIHANPHPDGLKMTLVWASPPCLDFSTGFNAPGPTAKRSGLNFQPDLSPMLEAKRIIDEINPRFWCIENVIGSIKHFEPYLGTPRLIVGSFVLYGNFPLFDARDVKHNKSDVDPGPSNPLRANYRAKVPYALSDALRQAIENQTSLFDMFDLS